MTKRKTLIFSLSAIIFLALSFIVYSWTEPTIMPSSYDPPINTSTNAQTKKGQLKLEEALYAPIVIDRDGCVGESCPYYINPSGDSMISGKIITKEVITSKDAPNTLVSKGYVDSLFSGDSEEEGEVLISNLAYKVGKNPDCGEGIMVMRGWDPVTCQGSTYSGSCPGSSCTTSVEWVRADTTPTCSYYSTGYPSCTKYDSTCVAKTWSEVICAKMEDALFGQKHTESQCRALGGTVVTVEGDVKICKFPVTTQCFKQRSCSDGTCHSSLGGMGSYTREAIYECPSGWTKYKKFVTTKRKTWNSSDFIYLCRDCSDSRPDCSNYCYGSTCTANPEDERVFSNKNNNVDACSIYCSTPYRAADGNYYGQAEVIEAGCY
jgi:hypothetical protein